MSTRRRVLLAAAGVVVLVVAVVAAIALTESPGKDASATLREAAARMRGKSMRLQLRFGLRVGGEEYSASLAGISSADGETQVGDLMDTTAARDTTKSWIAIEGDQWERSSVH